MHVKPWSSVAGCTFCKVPREHLHELMPNKSEKEQNPPTSISNLVSALGSKKVKFTDRVSAYECRGLRRKTRLLPCCCQRVEGGNGGSGHAARDAGKEQSSWTEPWPGSAGEAAPPRGGLKKWRTSKFRNWPVETTVCRSPNSCVGGEGKSPEVCV